MRRQGTEILRSMFKNILIGQYIDTGSVLHGIDARIKIMAVIVMAIMIFAADKYTSLIYMLAICVFFAGMAKISLSALIKGIRPVIFLAIFTFIFNIFTSEGTELFSVGAFVCTYEGLYTGAVLALRLIMIAAAATVLTLTTKPLDLTAAIESLLSPLNILNIPVRDIAVMMGISIRFIPTLGDEARRIADAQRSRGADFEGKGIIKKAYAALPLIVPLMTGAFRHSDTLAEAMDARCYGMGKRTRMNAHRLGKNDAAAAAVMLAAALIFAGVELL